MSTSISYFSEKVSVNHYNYDRIAQTMRVGFHADGDSLHWNFILQENDGVYTEKISMVKKSFSIRLPEDIEIEKIHPDHLALITLLAVHPFVDQEIIIPLEVSERFSNSCKMISSYKVIFNSSNGDTYESGPDAIPGLAFSGGADSTASLLLMPKYTHSVFLDRPLFINPLKRKSLYDKSAAYATIEHARHQGFKVDSIECDIEYMRKPLGFPTDLVPSIPLLAIASQRNIDSIAFGTVMESAYRIGHEQARDYADSSHYRFWGRMFKAAGLPLFLPVSGVSEVGTSKIVNMSSFKEYTRSCIRGIWPDSCENCWKCFRKNMINQKLQNIQLTDQFISDGLRIKEVKLKLGTVPVSHENVLSWALDGNDGKLINLLKNRFEGVNRDLSFLEGFFPPAIDLMPLKYQDGIRNRLEHYLFAIDEKYYPEIITHSMTEWKNRPSTKEAFAKFNQLF